MHRHDCDGGPHSFPNQRFKLVHAPCKFAAFQRDSHGGVTDRNGFPLFHSPNPNWLPPAFNRKSPRVFAGDAFSSRVLPHGFEHRCAIVSIRCHRSLQFSEVHSSPKPRVTTRRGQEHQDGQWRPGIQAQQQQGAGGVHRKFHEPNLAFTGLQAKVPCAWRYGPTSGGRFRRDREMQRRSHAIPPARACGANLTVALAASRSPATRRVRAWPSTKATRSCSRRQRYIDFDGTRLAMLKTLGEHAQSENLRLGHGVLWRGSIREHAG